jgi:hypothetical protein
MVLIVVCLLLPNIVGAGDLNPPGPPGSTMHTLEDIYTIVDNINNKVDPEPCGPCDPTGAGVEKTGQTKCYNAGGTEISCTGTGQDGEYQKGVTWPNPRFTNNGDGTVTDNLTGLIWLKNANCPNTGRTWATALSDVAQLNTDGTMNSNDCGDTSNGGSHQTDWRLPNVKELQSLIDYSQYNPALPIGHPFTAVSSYYWSGTTSAYSTSDAWYFSLYAGEISKYLKSGSLTAYVWPVRSGN